MSLVDRTSSEFSEYLELYERASLLELGQLADAERWRQHPENVVTYIIDRNINYTNVCVADCKFCAFYRRPKHSEGYVLSFEQIGAKIDECKAIGGVQILLQGGHNPYIPFEWYLELMRYIKQHHPIHIHGFSPSEVVFFSERFGLPVAEVVRELRAAGLDSIPGGGGEILVDAVRERVARKKAQTEEWLGVQEEAHRQGMKTSVTMMYGLGESNADRIEHLFRVRELQARTGGFTAFICWPLQPEGTEMATPAEDRRRGVPPDPGNGANHLRQRPQPSVVLGHHGTQGGTGGAPVRGQRLRQPDDGGERGLRRLAPPTAPRIEEMERCIRDAGLRGTAPAPGLLDHRRSRPPWPHDPGRHRL